MIIYIYTYIYIYQSCRCYLFIMYLVIIYVSFVYTRVSHACMYTWSPEQNNRNHKIQWMNHSTYTCSETCVVGKRVSHKRKTRATPNLHPTIIKTINVRNVFWDMVRSSKCFIQECIHTNAYSSLYVYKTIRNK